MPSERAVGAAVQARKVDGSTAYVVSVALPILVRPMAKVTACVTPGRWLSLVNAWGDSGAEDVTSTSASTSLLSGATEGAGVGAVRCGSVAAAVIDAWCRWA